MNNRFLMPTVLSLSLLTGSFSTANGSGDPVVSYKYPNNFNTMGGSHTKEVQCSTLQKIPDENGKIENLRITIPFARQVDANNQKIAEPSSNINLDRYLIFQHFARSHGLCLSQFGQTERAFGKSDADIQHALGPQWDSKAFCPVLEVRNSCKSEYQARGLWRD